MAYSNLDFAGRDKPELVVESCKYVNFGCAESEMAADFDYSLFGKVSLVNLKLLQEWDQFLTFALSVFFKDSFEICRHSDTH